MGSLLNFGRLYVHTIHQHAGGQFFCATRFGLKALYRHLGMKLLWQLSSKKGIPLVVEITGLFHCLPLVTKYLQQFCCGGWKMQVPQDPNLAYTIWFSFWLRLCGCTLHCKAESGKCMGPEKRKLASLGLGLGQSFWFNFSCRFGQCNVAFWYSLSFLFSGPWHLQWEALHGARWRRNFSPAPPVLWHFSKLSFIPLSVFDRHDVAHSRCYRRFPFTKGPSPNTRNQGTDVCWWYFDSGSQQWRCWNLHAVHRTGWAYVWVATELVSKESLLYLGSFFCDNGSIGPELNRRLGAARAESQTLCRVWNHAVLPKAEKIRIFEACVLSNLLYCLHTAWLNKAELRRLNAFQAKCFRKILNIPHSFVSRISNKIVLEQSGRQEISSILTYRQVVLFGNE